MSMKAKGILYIGIVVGILACFLFCAIACKGAKSTGNKGEAVKVTESTPTTLSIATAMCNKFASCDPSQKDSLEECIKTLTQKFDNELKSKNLSPSKEDVANCASSIDSGTCKDIIELDTPPAACEFLK